MIFEAQIVDTSRKGEYQIMQECVEQAAFGEKMGFDRIWAVEHHCLKWYAHMSAPETFLAYVAGKTSKIRIGHGVVCLPFRMNHPVKVAERIGMLDMLTKGRVDFGIGKGGTPQEAGAFQTEMEEIPGQLEESARMIPRMWREEYFEHDSPTMKIPKRPIFPKPYQDPHPPMYLACTRESTLNQAGEWGLGALVLGFAGPEDIAKKNPIANQNADRFVHAIFCDDIRQELGNKVSFMGCYQSELFVPFAPLALPKLCVYVTISTPAERPFKALSIRVDQGSNTIANIDFLFTF